MLQWARAFPGEPLPRDKLATLLVSQQRYDEGILYRREAIARTGVPASRAISSVWLVSDLYLANRHDDAKAAAEVARNALSFSASAPERFDRLLVSRGWCSLNVTLALMSSRLGRHGDAVNYAIEAETHSRHSFALAQNQADRLIIERERRYAANDIANALSLKTRMLAAAGRISQSEEALKASVQFATDAEIRPLRRARIFSDAASLRFEAREFVQAETYARRADQMLEAMGERALDPVRASLLGVLASALEGQRRWVEASAMFDKADAMAGGDSRLRARVRHDYVRALAFIHTGRALQAVPLLESTVQNRLERYGQGHYFTAQAVGMKGVALWLNQTPDGRQQALPLLKQAVKDYMSPANSDYGEDTGMRREVRELIFATYLEAMSMSPGEDVTETLGPAD